MSGILTKAAKQKVWNSGVGFGYLVMKTAHNEFMTVEVYIGRDDKLHRVADGEPVFPIEVYDTDENNEPISFKVTA